MSEMVNPHDKFFKEVFSHKDTAGDFLANYLPEPVLNLLDRDRIEIVKESFIEKDLKEGHGVAGRAFRQKKGTRLC